MKAETFKRIMAYIIDMVIIGMIVNIVVSVFPVSNKLEKLYKDVDKATESYTNKKINSSKYISQTRQISYKIERETVIEQTVSVTIYILYFVVFQFVNKGKTIGKQIFKIKLETLEKGEPSPNCLLIRSFFLYGILKSILLLLLILILSENSYILVSNIFSYIQTAILFACFITMLYRKDGRGLHDIISKTVVLKQ